MQIWLYWGEQSWSHASTCNIVYLFRSIYMKAALVQMAWRVPVKCCRRSFPQWLMLCTVAPETQDWTRSRRPPGCAPRLWRKGKQQQTNRKKKNLTGCRYHKIPFFIWLTKTSRVEIITVFLCIWIFDFYMLNSSS